MMERNWIGLSDFSASCLRVWTWRGWFAGVPAGLAAGVV
jgi:hypothetical protein